MGVALYFLFCTTTIITTNNNATTDSFSHQLEEIFIKCNWSHYIYDIYYLWAG
jgi:hypothetical protein